MLGIHPAGSLAESCQTFLRSPIQGAVGELLVYDPADRTLYVAVPMRRWPEYTWIGVEASPTADHAILPFRRQA
jgi:hypothetical protein